jgi:hypothetical protein
MRSPFPTPRDSWHADQLGQTDASGVERRLASLPTDVISAKAVLRYRARMGEPPEIIATVGGPIDETHVTLAVYGDDLDPDAVTALLGCSPTRAHRQGDPKGPRSPPARRGGWFLESRGTAPTDAESLTRSLLDKLPADDAVWTKVHAAYEVQLRLGLFMNAWNRGFDLSVELVARVAALKLPLLFDIYADEGKPKSAER